MTVYRQGSPPDVEHRWLRWRRRCTCGWTQRQGPNPFRYTGSGFVRLSLGPPINYPYHLEDMAEWEASDA